MAAPSTQNVISGKAKATGAVFRGPLDVAAPTDATSPLDTKLLCLGYAGEDGLTETTDRSTDKIKAWGGDTVKIVQTEHSVTYKVVLIEEGNPEVLKAVYGDANVETATATKTTGTLHKVKVNSTVLPPAAWDFEMAEAATTVRVFLPKGQVSSVGDVQYVDEGVISYEVEIEALPDEHGVKAYKFIDMGDRKPA